MREFFEGLPLPFLSFEGAFILLGHDDTTLELLLSGGQAKKNSKQSKQSKHSKIYNPSLKPFLTIFRAQSVSLDFSQG